MEASEVALEDNVNALAQFAALCQRYGMVPIVEPEVMVLEGSHDIAASRATSERVVKALMAALEARGVVLGAVLLKVAMVLPSRAVSEEIKATKGKTFFAELVGEETVKMLNDSVPKEIGGIVFLSGGQDDDDAMCNLGHVCKSNRACEEPFRMSFSYGRALQQAALKEWAGRGDAEGIASAQRKLVERCKLASLALVAN